MHINIRNINLNIAINIKCFESVFMFYTLNVYFSLQSDSVQYFLDNLDRIARMVIFNLPINIFRIQKMYRIVFIIII